MVKIGEIPETGGDTKIFEEGKSYMVQFLSDEAEERKVQSKDGSEFTRYVFPAKVDNEQTKVGLSAFTVSQLRKQMDKMGKTNFLECKWMLSVAGSGRNKRTNVNLIP
jgi:hypothetical protein